MSELEARTRGACSIRVGLARGGGRCSSRLGQIMEEEGGRRLGSGRSRLEEAAMLGVRPKRKGRPWSHPIMKEDVLVDQLRPAGSSGTAGGGRQVGNGGVGKLGDGGATSAGGLRRLWSGSDLKQGGGSSSGSPMRKEALLLGINPWRRGRSHRVAQSIGGIELSGSINRGGGRV